MQWKKDWIFTIKDKEKPMYKVVIVDDEPIIVEGLTKSLPWEQWGCQVVGTAESGVEGIQVVNRTNPHILITDINMPEIDGLTMIAALKSSHPHLEIAILTGYRDFEYAREAIRLGVTRLLLKPSKIEELKEAVLAMVAKSELAHIDSAHTQPSSSQDDIAEEEEDDIVMNEAGNFIVKNALTYIKQNYMQKLKLSDVADQVYVSQWHLSKLLNRYTSQSFSELLNTERIENAKQLLKDPELRVGDVAEIVGFLEVAHFSRVFKKLTGVSANEYRRQISVI
jgi:two-component system response regulator YesN